ncbi:DUF3450 domain-containing protein [Halopseudomonas aestusnigri]|uniref:DUF3450 domain-containing protein n=1 Tax=Halopseudomonas aestusnigri TaxID=857252 RepID=A0AAQ1JRA8_9GAMM|nr:DUF3450 domain-containing protein [Halopseudomonas aestusnigri]SEG68028.1 Protein of unknown function [Halopseudomonas aestusnigri]
MKPLWLAVVLLTLPLTLQAQQSLEQAQQQSQALVDDAVAAQQRINELDQATRAALEAYRHAVTQADALTDYSERMQQLVASQADEIASLQQQIDSVADTQREMLPLIRRMIESLDAFIALDLPFLLDEREERVARLQALLVDPDVSVAELYRRVLEAYQIESEYGRTLEAWRGALKDGDQQRVVEFLRVGRLMLFFQSLDGQHQGYWDAAHGQWQALPSSYRRALDQGMAIARNEQTPQMLRLPMPQVSVEVAP